MFRILFILLTLSNSINALSQTVSFDSTVLQLFFGVNVYNEPGAVVDSLKQVADLKYDDTVARFPPTRYTNKEETWTSVHVFTFTQSPLPGIKIDSGRLTLRLKETDTTQTIESATWRAYFDNKEDGELCYNKLKKMLTHFSAKESVLENITKYAVRTETEKGIREASIYFGISSQTKKYDLFVFLPHAMISVSRTN